MSESLFGTTRSGHRCLSCSLQPSVHDSRSTVDLALLQHAAGHSYSLNSTQSSCLAFHAISCVRVHQLQMNLCVQHLASKRGFLASRLSASVGGGKQEQHQQRTYRCSRRQRIYCCCGCLLSLRSFPSPEGDIRCVLRYEVPLKAVRLLCVCAYGLAVSVSLAVGSLT